MENYPHLSIELVWEDSDLEELLISASNGRYSGTAQVYFALGEIKDLADRIRGFPRAVSQEAIFSGGAEDSDGFARLVFKCVDGVGHTIVKVSLPKSFRNMLGLQSEDELSSTYYSNQLRLMSSHETLSRWRVEELRELFFEGPTHNKRLERTRR